MPRKRGVGSEEATRQLLRLAAVQHGAVGTRQLRKLNVTWEQVRDRRNPGWLSRVHQGVYALVGRESEPLTRWMAAVLACGPGAVLSHLDAARLWGLLPMDRRVDRSIHVTIPAETNRRRRRGIALHRRDLADAERTARRRIPVTTAARTILDLAHDLDRRRLERVIDEGERLGACGTADLSAVLERNRGAVGTARLAEVVRSHAAGSTLTRSELEERFLRLCRERDLPQPLVNASVLGLTIDFFWPPALVVEVDGAASHLTRHAFHDDRDRDTLLVSNGYRVLRFTWRDIANRPAVVAQRVRRALSI
jgi:very-short-patch-repair endonuclease